MSKSLYDSFIFLSNQLIASVFIFLPKLLMVLVIFVLGLFLAKTIKKVTITLLEKMRLSKTFKKTPVNAFLQDMEAESKVEKVVGGVLYWLVMLVIIQTVVGVLGLQSLTDILGKILAYLPTVLSALLIFFFGLLVSGLVESLVKGVAKSIDGKSSILLGKIASYAVMVVTILATISELGIAQEFIFIIFIGFVISFALTFGLAFGLGGKEVVGLALKDWYREYKKLKK